LAVQQQQNWWNQPQKSDILEHLHCLQLLLRQIALRIQWHVKLPPLFAISPKSMANMQATPKLNRLYQAPDKK